jgi:transcriptional regulator with XRE-family HTH domain
MVFDPRSFELATRLREIRLRQGLEQAAVAYRIGVSPSVISLWERGRRLVPGHRVPALAAALGVSVEELRGHTRARSRPEP